MPSHLFRVVDTNRPPESSPGTFTLVKSNWDEYHFKTSFTLYYAGESSSVHLGTVKIAEIGMVVPEVWVSGSDAITSLPATFTELGERYFSLGQDIEYYERLLELPGGIGLTALAALRDVAASPTTYDQASKEASFRTSLLRFIPENTVTNQFRRLVSGGDKLVSYSFMYEKPLKEGEYTPFHLDFDVAPNAIPPQNIHALIGPNGAGKSTILKDFFRAAIGDADAEGRFMQGDSNELPFVNVLHISYSAFDNALDWDRILERDIEAEAVGLAGNPKQLVEQFYESLEKCSSDSRKERWQNLMALLSKADPGLGELPLDSLELRDLLNAKDAFNRMSSGHKIVTLTITRLVELVKEKSLILIDEPETHLHPPLLSALIRAIAELATNRNGIAIIATHSPVVLQEVPGSCVWMIQRSGELSQANRLSIETFGESVSRLTSEVFRLSIDHTGFREILFELLRKNHGSIPSTLGELDNKLGAEGRFLLSSLELQMKNQDVQH